MRRLLGYAGVTIVLLIVGLIVAAQVDLISFEAGELIRADEVNQNFQALASELEASRLPQGCRSGEVAEWNGADWACAEDDVGEVGGGLTAVSHDATLSGDGSTDNPLALAQQEAAEGQVLKWDGSSWTPGEDADTEYTAGSGLQLSDNILSIRSGGVSSSMLNLPLTLTAGSTKALEVNGSGSGISNAALRVNNTSGGIGAFIGATATGSSDAVFVLSQKGNGPLLKAFGNNGGNEEIRIDPNGTVYLFKVGASSTADFNIKLDNANGNVSAVAFNTVSDQSLKEHFTAVDKGGVLSQLAHIPIESWTFKSDTDAVRHLGPTAQDFYAAFGLGADNRHIATVDADGVAFVAIQALYEENQILKTQVADLEARLQRLEAGN